MQTSYLLILGKALKTHMRICTKKANVPMSKSLLIQIKWTKIILRKLRNTKNKISKKWHINHVHVYTHTHTHFITTIMYHGICLFCYSPPSIIFFLSFISRQCWNHLIKDDIIPPLNLTPTVVSYFVRFSYPYNLICMKTLITSFASLDIEYLSKVRRI